MSAVLQTPLGEVLAHCDNTIRGPLSLVRHAQRILNQPGLPRIHNASSIINSIKTYNHAELVGDTGAAGLTWEEAAMGAIGECIERYCCAVYDHDDLVYASQRDLGATAIGMDTFAIYSERQQAHPDFPLNPWHPELPVHWVEGRVLGTGSNAGAKRQVPACLAYIPYAQHPDLTRTRDRLALAVSSGQACHSDTDAALLSGLCEVVERDAFMITWLKRVAVPRIEWEHDDELRRIYERHFACPGLTFHLFDLTLDIEIPTVVCLVEGMGPRGPYLCLGAATRPNYRQAITKAWIEASQTLVWLRDLMARKQDWRPEPDYVNLRDFEDHVRLYGEPEMRAHAAFLLDTPLRVRPDFDRHAGAPAAELLAGCINAVERAGYEAIHVDLTTCDIRSAGFVVPKVFVPGLTTLYATHGLPCVGSPRFDSVPRKLGRPALPDGEFNLSPHPFP